MKKLFIVFMAILIFCVPVMSASAGAPKLIYELGDDFVDASIKAVQARKGFKVVEGSEGAGEVFTNAVKKNMQDTAQETWQVINGGKFDKTPLRDMPGWFKVTLGTAAFVTGADIAFDIYDSIQNNQSVDTLSMDLAVAGSMYFDNQFAEGRIGNPGTKDQRFDVITKDGYQIYYSSSYKNPGRIVTTFYQKLGMPLPYFEITGWSNDYKTLYVTLHASISSLFDNERPMRVYKLDGSPFKLDAPINKTVAVSPNQVERRNVPDIDTSKETQTIIVPDPVVYPDLDKAINDNWDMVADPEKWLAENPEYDPDVEVPPIEEPPPVEEPETPPLEMPEPLPKPEPLPVEVPEVPAVDTDIGWLQKIWEAIVTLPVRVWNSAIDFLVPSDPAPIIEATIPLKEEIEEKFNQPSDFAFLKTAIADKGESCPQDITAFGAVIVEFDYVCDKAKWFRPIMVGFVYFLFGWWLFRKANALMAKNGGIQ